MKTKLGQALLKGLKEAVDADKKNKKEIFKLVSGFEKQYKVSNYGRILSLPRNTTHGGILKGTIKNNGYIEVNLMKNGKNHYLTIHRLVALTFIPNLNNLPTVNHKDGNKSNNHVENLEWCSHSEQLKHGHRLGLMNHQGENHSCHKLTNTQVRDIYKLATSTKLTHAKIGKMFNVTGGNVSLIKRKKRWHHILKNL